MDSNIDNIDNQLDGDDFVVVQTENGEIVGGGYKIDSLFLQQDTSPMVTLNQPEYSGGKPSSPFENLAVPAGLFYVNMRVPKKHKNVPDEHYNKHETISDDLFDKLYSLIEVDKKRKRKTKKQRVKTDKNKSRKIR